MQQSFKDVLSISTAYLPTKSETINFKKNIKEALKTQPKIETEKKYFRGDKQLNGFQKSFYI